MRSCRVHRPCPANEASSGSLATRRRIVQLRQRKETQGLLRIGRKLLHAQHVEFRRDLAALLKDDIGKTSAPYPASPVSHSFVWKPFVTIFSRKRGNYRDCYPIPGSWQAISPESPGNPTDPDRGKPPDHPEDRTIPASWVDEGSNGPGRFVGDPGAPRAAPDPAPHLKAQADAILARLQPRLTSDHHIIHRLADLQLDPCGGLGSA